MAKRKAPPPPSRPPAGIFDWPSTHQQPLMGAGEAAMMSINPAPSVMAPPQANANANPPVPPPPTSPFGQASSQFVSAPTTPSFGSMPAQNFGAPQAGQQFGAAPAWTSVHPGPVVSRYQPPQGPSTGVKMVIGLAIAFLAVVVVGILAAVAIPVFLNQRAKADLAKGAMAANLTPAQLAAAPYCGAAITNDMPADTRSYVTALIALNGAHATYTAKVRANGNVASLSDLNGINTNDAAFVRAVSTIKWSNPIKAAQSQQVIGTVHNYDSALSAQTLSQGATPSDDSDLRAATSQRAIATQTMRAMLGLPRSTCSFAPPL